MKFVVVVVVSILLAIGVLQLARSMKHDRPVTEIDAPSAALKEAVQKARASLPTFIARLKKPEPHDRAFAIEARMTAGTQTAEHIWIDHLTFDGKQFTGRFADVPLTLPGMHKGDSTTVRPVDISDWTIVHDDGTREGDFTSQALKAR